MKKYFILIPLLFSVFIPFSWGSSGAQARGEDTAKLLTSLYNNAVADCGSDLKPAYLCSGITMRATETNPAFFPWNPSPNSQVSGGVSFSWLRVDSNFSRGAFHYLNGFIVYPEMLMPAEKKKLEPICYFPVDADSLNRPGWGGCGNNTYYPDDSYMCNLVIPKPITPEKWLAHYTSVKNTAGGIEQHRHQCSFELDAINSNIPAESFLTGIESRKLLDDSDKLIQNEMIIQLWEQDIPEQLPVMAFYYLGGTDEKKGLANAQNDQLRFYQQTNGQIVPLIKVTLPATFTGEATFAYSESEQAVKDDIAWELNYLYGYTPDNCGSDSKPAFLCSGVMMRGTETSPDFFPWNPSPNSQAKGGVAFSWLRKDSNFTSFAYSYLNGFIFYPVLNRPVDSLWIEILCYFPVDANSENRPTLAGCGANTAYPNDSGLCHELNPRVDTAASWYKHFTSVSSSKRHAHQCAFDVRDEVNHYAGPNFLAGIGGRAKMSSSEKKTNNEIILATWPQDVPEQLPMMAFWYLGGGKNEAKGRADAQNDQLRFSQQTGGVVVPVVKVVLPSSFSGTAKFTYSDSDQVVK